MAKYVHPDVEAIRDDPEADAMIHLVIVPEADRIDSAIELIQRIGGDVADKVPLDMLKANIPQTALDELVEHPDVQAVHLDDEMEVLAPGNL